MTRITFLIVFFASVITALAQNEKVKVSYDLSYGVVNNTETLIADQENAKYSNTFVTVNNDNNVSQESENQYSVKSQKVIKLDKIITYQQKSKDIIYQVHYKDKNKFLTVRDSLPQFDWKFTHEKKEILGFSCTKATCSYRGSKIVAYFTQKLSYPFGPWKFGKLPGLILEVYTEDSSIDYHWKATQIIYPYIDNIDLSLDIEIKSEIIDMKEYVTDRDEKINERFKIMDSRSPKGTTVKSKTQRLGVEKIYEWETQQNQE